MISYFEGRSDLDDILLTDPDLHLQKIFHQLWFGDGESIRVKIKVLVKVMVKVMVMVMGPTCVVKVRFGFFGRGHGDCVGQGHVHDVGQGLRIVD